jgi:hypothetical protein
MSLATHPYVVNLRTGTIHRRSRGGIPERCQGDQIQRKKRLTPEQAKREHVSGRARWCKWCFA